MGRGGEFITLKHGHYKRSLPSLEATEFGRSGGSASETRPSPGSRYDRTGAILLLDKFALFL